MVGKNFNKIWGSSSCELTRAIIRLISIFPFSLCLEALHKKAHAMVWASAHLLSPVQATTSIPVGIHLYGISFEKTLHDICDGKLFEANNWTEKLGKGTMVAT